MPALRKLHGLAVWPRSSTIYSDLWDKQHYEMVVMVSGN